MSKFYRATKIPSRGYGFRHEDKPNFPPVRNPTKVGFPGTPQRGMLNSFYKDSVYVSSTPEGAHNFILENPNNIGFKWDIHEIKIPEGSYLDVTAIGGHPDGEAKNSAIDATTKSVKEQYRQIDNDEVRAAVEKAENKPLGRQAFHEVAHSYATSYVDDVAKYNKEHVTSRVYPKHVRLYRSYDYRRKKDGESKFYGAKGGTEIREGVARWNEIKSNMVMNIYKAASQPLLTKEQIRTQTATQERRTEIATRQKLIRSLKQKQLQTQAARNAAKQQLTQQQIQTQAARNAASQ